MLTNIKTAIGLSNPRKLRVNLKHCSICEAVRPILRLNDNEIAIRCLGCRASIVSMTMAHVIETEFPILRDKKVYELSARGPLVKYLAKKCKNLQTSEFYPNVPLGGHNGVLCQDVQNLTFENNSFDLVTSTDVFEHVPDDLMGLKNVYRVLKPAGKTIFTVPMFGETTVQRARYLMSGQLEHMLPPEYHGDPVSASGKILAFRSYGLDIVSLLKSVGFKDVRIASPEPCEYWGTRRDVVVAQK